jgi:ATP-dependent DNA helicase RecG
MTEGITLDKKSLRVLTLDPNRWDWPELARDSVGFANARGGVILFGIEDHADAPPPDQRIADHLPDRLVKGIYHHTINVAVSAEIRDFPSGGQVLVLHILPSAKTLAATTGNRYFVRVADETRSVPPDQMIRLLADKDAYQWEPQISLRVPASLVDPEKLSRFHRDLAASRRVKDCILDLPSAELLERYSLVREGFLTNLGILWLGRREDRARLLHAPIIQFLKYDARGERVAKRVWDDYSLNPAELIEAVWTEVPDWRESTELPDGLFRKNIPHYDEVVIRELLANALVHRPYTTRGDIFINLHPGHLEFHNPGPLPLGVTPHNILQKTIRRNDLLAQLFHDLGLMEREGSGYDRIYETQLAQAKALPLVTEDEDRVTVRVDRRILRPELVDFLARLDQQFELSRRERIALGLVAQHGSLTALEFGRLLQIEEDARLRSWLGRLLDLGIVHTSGQTRATEYLVAPEILRATDFKGRTTLKKIAPHRLKHLVLEDLSVHGPSAEKITTLAQIHRRIGDEIGLAKLRYALRKLVREGVLRMTGKRGKGGGYYLVQKSAK